MPNSPIPDYRAAIRQVYATQNCDARLAGCEPTVIYREPYFPPKNGFVEHRFEERRSADNSVIVQSDVYVHEDGYEVLEIVDLEIDGQEYYALRDTPHPLRPES